MNTGFGIMDAPDPMEGIWLGEMIAADRTIANWQVAYSEQVDQYNKLVNQYNELRQTTLDLVDSYNRQKENSERLQDAIEKSEASKAELEAKLKEIRARESVTQRHSFEVARVTASDASTRSIIDLQLQALEQLNPQHSLLNEDARDDLYYDKHKEAVSAYRQRFDRRWIYDYANITSLMSVMVALDDAIRELSHDHPILSGKLKNDLHLKAFLAEMDKLSDGNLKTELDDTDCFQSFDRYVKKGEIMDPLLPKPAPASTPKI